MKVLQLLVQQLTTAILLVVAAIQLAQVNNQLYIGLIVFAMLWHAINFGQWLAVYVVRPAYKAMKAAK